MNIIGIAGNITKDIELKKTSSGKTFVAFCVAVRRPFTSDKTDFIDCVAFERTAEFIDKYFRKGSGIIVDGYLATDSYKDKDGNSRKSVKIICQNVDFKDRKKDNEGTASKNDATETTTESSMQQGDFVEIEDEDLPF